VGFEVAQALRAPLDLVLVRKIGAPRQPELAIGAIADGAQPDLVSDAGLMAMLAVSEDYLDQARAAALTEIERRRELYLGGSSPVPVAGRDAILVDDGIATGATVAAALRSLRHRGPARAVLAVPVASPQALDRLAPEADEIVCLDAPDDFYAVGQFYVNFAQLDDADVIALLARARQFASGGQHG
jgi:putative phosphoribosyl transferase